MAYGENKITGLKGLGKQDFNNAVTAVKVVLDARANLATFAKTLQNRMGQLNHSIQNDLKKATDEAEKTSIGALVDKEYAKTLAKLNELKESLPVLENAAKKSLGSLSTKTAEKIPGYSDL